MEEVVGDMACWGVFFLIIDGEGEERLFFLGFFGRNYGIKEYCVFDMDYNWVISLSC